MDFEIMGETENWIVLEKDSLGVEFKSNSISNLKQCRKMN